MQEFVQPLGAARNILQPEAPRRAVSSAQAHWAFFLSSARANETRWAISSSIGVTLESSARDPDPGQF